MLKLNTAPYRQLYRDSDGFYNHLPPRAGFYEITESVGNSVREFPAIAKMGQWGSLEFHCIKDGEWINYSESIPDNAVVEFRVLELEGIK